MLDREDLFYSQMGMFVYIALCYTVRLQYRKLKNEGALKKFFFFSFYNCIYFCFFVVSSNVVFSLSLDYLISFHFEVVIQEFGYLG